MNRVILMGRLTRDPDIRYAQGENGMEVARYTLAVDRRRRREDGQQNADFISCVAFGRSAEFAEKYLHKGIKILVTGRIQTGSYTNREGNRVYTTDVVVEDQEFAESRSVSEANTGAYGGGSYGGSSYGSGSSMPPQNSMPEPARPADGFGAGPADGDGFMNIPDGIDEELPFQ